jgi:hypothetical protein
MVTPTVTTEDDDDDDDNTIKGLFFSSWRQQKIQVLVPRRINI